MLMSIAAVAAQTDSDVVTIRRPNDGIVVMTTMNSRVPPPWSEMEPVQMIRVKKGCQRLLRTKFSIGRRDHIKMGPKLMTLVFAIT